MLVKICLLLDVLDLISNADEVTNIEQQANVDRHELRWSDTLVTSSSAVDSCFWCSSVTSPPRKTMFPLSQGVSYLELTL